MSMNPPDLNEVQRAVAQAFREHWVLFLIEGIVLVVLGVLAILVPALPRSPCSYGMSYLGS